MEGVRGKYVPPAVVLFGLVNLVCEKMSTEPKHVEGCPPGMGRRRERDGLRERITLQEGAGP
jgi:hypothetical protein